MPVEERVLIVDSLLRSLNQPQSGIDDKWIMVARKRLAEMRSGSVEAVPGDKVFEKIWKRFENNLFFSSGSRRRIQPGNRILRRN